MRAMPLDFKRGIASELAAEWQETYKARVARDPFLEIKAFTRFVQSVPLPDGRLAALFQRRNGEQQWEKFDFILNCTGFGEEQVSLPGNQHASYQFWADDLLEAPDFGFSHPTRTPRVLISGGGDDALQDFLRIAFPNLSAGEIYDRLLPESTMRDVRTEIERRVFATEDAFRRAWAWSEDACLDCEVLQQLHTVHLDAAHWAVEKR